MMAVVEAWKEVEVKVVEKLGFFFFGGR